VIFPNVHLSAHASIALTDFIFFQLQFIDAAIKELRSIGHLHRLPPHHIPLNLHVEMDAWSVRMFFNVFILDLTAVNWFHRFKIEC
jgi:hypothetical protein